MMTEYTPPDYGGYSNPWECERHWQKDRLEISDVSPFLALPELQYSKEGLICKLLAAISDDAYLIFPGWYAEFNQLIEQLGYTEGSEYREDFMLAFCCKWWNGKKRTFSKVLMKLVLELEIAQAQLLKRAPSQYIAVTDLSAFVFCPVSYAIKRTYEIPQTVEVKAGLNLHNQHYLKEFLTSLRPKQATTPSDYKVSVESEVIRDLLDSRIIFEGHGHPAKPFFNSKGNLGGIPDYIFQRPNGSKFVVEEKHTWRGAQEIRSPWKSDITQVLGYIYGLQDFQFTNGYLIYFPWSIEKEAKTKQKRLSLDSPKIFKVEKSEADKEFLINIYHSVTRFKKDQVYPFDVDSLNVNKCSNCSVRFFCKHKAGTLDTIPLPYPR